MTIEPLAVQPVEAARLLSVSRRQISRLIRAHKLVARKLGKRTLVDVDSIKALYSGLPLTSGKPIDFGERAHVRPRLRPRKVRHKR